MILLKRFYRMVSYNLPWKLAALFASTTLWMAINGSEPNADRYLRLGVSHFGLSRELVIADQDTWTVEVQLRGPRSILQTIDEEYHRVALNLRGVEAGSMSRKLVPEMLNLPRRVRVVRISPPRVQVRVERLLRKSIPVKAVLVPPRRNGYTVSDPTVTPESVEVSGPSSRVNRLRTIETEPVNTLVNGQVDREVSLAGAGEWLYYSPRTVRVAFSVSEVEGQRTFAAVAVSLRGAPAGSILDPATVDVTVRGPELLLMSLKPQDVAPHVDGDGFEPGVHTVELQVAIPEGFRLASASPAVLRLTVPKPTPQAEDDQGSNGITR